jgi:hypothetical protein
MRNLLNIILMAYVLTVGILLFKDVDLNKVATVGDMLKALCLLVLWVYATRTEK